MKDLKNALIFPIIFLIKFVKKSETIKKYTNESNIIYPDIKL